MTREPKHSLALLLGAALLGMAVLGGGLWYKLGRQPAPAAAQPPQTAQPANPLIDQPRPEFMLADLDGRARALKEWDGKVVAVNFWATWCPPCKRELPSFNALQRELGASGLQFLGVAVDDPGAVRDYLKTAVVDFPVLIGTEQKTIAIAEQYGNTAGVMPYTVIVDRQGRIAYVHYGELHQDLARQVILSLL